MAFLYEPSDLVVNIPIEDVSGAPNLTDLDQAAEAYFRFPLNASVAEFWFICVRVTRTGQSPEWIIYAFAAPDIPAGSFSVAPITAYDVAEGLVSRGFSVYLRHYTSATLAFSATKNTITL